MLLTYTLSRSSRRKNSPEAARGAQNLVVLVREDLLASLAASHSILLLLTQLRGGELLCLLGVLDLVTHGIVLILVLSSLLVDTGSRALTLNPVVAGSLETTITHSPHFGTERLGEVTVVGNDEHTTLELLEGLDKSSQRLTIEVV